MQIANLPVTIRSRSKKGLTESRPAGETGFRAELLPEAEIITRARWRFHNGMVAMAQTRTSCKNPISDRGVTIIELAIAMVVLAILVAAAVPSFVQLLRDADRTTVLSELTAALNLARSEALGRGVPVSVCRSADAASCSSGTWAEGWVVFVNDDNDAPAVVDAGEVILQVRREPDPAYALVPNNNYANFITYRANGSVNNIGRITYCDRRGVAEARAVLINMAGRVRLSRDANDDGIDEDEAGNDLACP